MDILKILLEKKRGGWRARRARRKVDNAEKDAKRRERGIVPPDRGDRRRAARGEFKLIYGDPKGKYSGSPATLKNRIQRQYQAGEVGGKPFPDTKDSMNPSMEARLNNYERERQVRVSANRARAGIDESTYRDSLLSLITEISDEKIKSVLANLDHKQLWTAGNKRVARRIMQAKRKGVDPESVPDPSGSRLSKLSKKVVDAQKIAAGGKPSPKEKSSYSAGKADAWNAYRGQGRSK